MTTVSFEVEARRTDTAAARDVVLPYYIAIVRGGTNVVAKRVGRVNVHFDAGQARGQVAGRRPPPFRVRRRRCPTMSAKS